MTNPQPSKFFLLFLVAAAVFGLALVPLLLLSPTLQSDTSPIRRPVVGAVYITICIAGVVAVFYPNKCSVSFKNISSSNLEKSSASEMQFLGHHPDCQKFSANRITIGKSVFCAACSGLLVGAIASLAAIVLFSLGFFGFGTGDLWVLAVGEALMLVGLAQIKFRGYAKLVVNALFVVGSAVCLVEADLVGQSLLVDGFVLGLIVFMLWFRILLSEWHNKKMCLACGRCV